MYTVWATQGQGSSPDGKFETLEEALKYVEKCTGHASFAIQLPDGTYYKWEENKKEEMTNKDRPFLAFLQKAKDAGMINDFVYDDAYTNESGKRIRRAKIKPHFSALPIIHIWFYEQWRV